MSECDELKHWPDRALGLSEELKRWRVRGVENCGSPVDRLTRAVMAVMHLEGVKPLRVSIPPLEWRLLEARYPSLAQKTLTVMGVDLTARLADTLKSDVVVTGERNEVAYAPASLLEIGDLLGLEPA